MGVAEAAVARVVSGGSRQRSVVDQGFWRGRRILVTGHTGFKGGWLTLWLRQLGAEVTGFSLPPPTGASLFASADVGRDVRNVFGDLRDPAAVRAAVADSRAEVVFHCAAQSLVRASYRTPAETFAVNVMGTVHVLDAIRTATTVKAVVVVTSDKCYEAATDGRAYVETDRLGGQDPYSSSKACAELAAFSYRTSFFGEEGAAIGTVRAGNVIGGGDWAEDRLVPDIIRACATGSPAVIRNPGAIRPWQHVLEPLSGYLLLGQALSSRTVPPGSWNFGPREADMRTVAEVAELLTRKWGDDASWTADGRTHPAEAPVLRLDSTRAGMTLGWRPRLTLDAALDWTVEWHKRSAGSAGIGRRVTEEQIARYQQLQSDVEDVGSEREA